MVSRNPAFIWILTVSMGLFFDGKTVLGLPPQRNMSLCDSSVSTTIAARYKVLDSPKSFKDARSTCEISGGRIAELKNTEQEKSLSFIAKNRTSHTDVWIGLRMSTLPNGTHQYRWQNCPYQLKNASWCPRVIQPPKAELCVAMSHECEWKWTVKDCWENSSFACEFPGYGAVLLDGSYRRETQMDRNLNTQKTTTVRSAANNVNSMWGTGISVNEVTTQDPIQYIPGRKVHAEYKNSALLDVRSKTSFILLPKTIYVHYDAMPPAVPKKRNMVSLQILLTNLLDVTPPENVPAGITYTILVNEKTVDQAVLSNPLTYGSSGGCVRFLSAEISCRYIDTTTGRQSSFGLRKVTNPDGTYSCISNHTTIFAALLSVTVVVVPRSATIIANIAESISVVSLILTLAILVTLRKKLNTDRTVVQISLCSALLLLHVVSLVHDTALSRDHFCELVAVVTHLSVLSAAFWMLIEGVTLIIKTSSHALRSESSRKVRVKQFTFGFIFPALIVACAAIPGFMLNTYMAASPITMSNLPGVNTYQKCWLNASSGLFIGTVTVPVGFAMFINVCILVRVGALVYKKSKNATNFKPIALRGNNLEEETSKASTRMEHSKASARAVLLLCPVLGVPWCFLFIAGTERELLFTTIILNGLQGLFLFLVYCIFNKKVMGCLKGTWRRTELARMLSSEMNVIHAGNTKTKDSNLTPSNRLSVGTDKTHSNVACEVSL